MKYQIIFLLYCGIRNSSQEDHVCYNRITGRRDVCCHNYEWTDGMCNNCKIGTTTAPGGRCTLCQKGTYGYMCGSYCFCDQTQRCDAKVGCIQKTSITAIHTTYTDYIESVSLPHEIVSSKGTIVINSETSISGWMILALCITSCFSLTGWCCFIRTHRKRLSIKARMTNAEVILYPLEPSQYIGVYDEVDENQLSFETTDFNLTSYLSRYETIDCDAQSRLSVTISTEHDETGYLDPVFAIEVDDDSQLADRISQKECFSSDSSRSVVVDQDNTAYNNLYQPLQDNWLDDSHGYEVPVMVHKCEQSSAAFDANVKSNSYYNVYHPLQKNRAFLSDITTGNSNDYINMHAESNISMKKCHTMEFCKPRDENKARTIGQNSFLGDFDVKIESKNSYLNNSYCSREDNNSHSDAYGDTKSFI